MPEPTVTVTTPVGDQLMAIDARLAAEGDRFVNANAEIGLSLGLDTPGIWTENELNVALALADDKPLPTDPAELALIRDVIRRGLGRLAYLRRLRLVDLYEPAPRTPVELRGSVFRELERTVHDLEEADTPLSRGGIAADVAELARAWRALGGNPVEAAEVARAGHTLEQVADVVARVVSTFPGLENATELAGPIAGAVLGELSEGRPA